METSRLRIAIVNADKCKPKKCRCECRLNCPVVKTGKLCIEVTSTSKIAFISEVLCIGCGICVKKCPLEAISIINLPKDLGKHVTHRFGPNSFKLHRLPTPKPGTVLGLVGTNGIGKSTALKILSGNLKPNLGNYSDSPSWDDILKYFRGSELQSYLTKYLEGSIKPIIKPQYVDQIPKSVKGTIMEVVQRKNENKRADILLEKLELMHIANRQIDGLSGGELQRFAICVAALHNSNVFMFDEPSSYLDVKQRLKAAQVIRDCLSHDNYVIAVEHDLSVLDYLSDFICCLWGHPSAYGVVTTPFGVREGINIFLDGFIPTENLRFREDSLNFKMNTDSDLLPEEIKRLHSFEYPGMTKTIEDFTLHVNSGDFSDSEIVVMLGQNGTGKTTFIRMLAGKLEPDDKDTSIISLNVSYKPQKINPKFTGSVRNLLLTKIKDSFNNPQFQTDVIKPLNIVNFIDHDVQLLSGGELQTVALIIALGKPADIYLIDEPSAYLDSQQRIIAARVIKRFILHSKKTAFVVEHDFIMATYLADRVIVYEGNPGINCTAGSPESLITGMNKFLKSLDISFRRDPTNFRPRINKLDSVKDKEQKLVGDYFMLEGN